MNAERLQYNRDLKAQKQAAARIMARWGEGTKLQSSAAAWMAAKGRGGHIQHHLRHMRWIRLEGVAMVLLCAG